MQSNGMTTFAKSLNLDLDLQNVELGMDQTVRQSNAFPEIC